VAQSSWRVIEAEDLDAGLRYLVRSGEREMIVLHQDTGFQGWNGQSRCEVGPAVKSAIMDYELDVAACAS
jgi:hypothetical protein